MVPMLIKEHLFKEISMNFIREFLELEGTNTIIVVTNKFSEVQYDILGTTFSTVADTYI